MHKCLIELAVKPYWGQCWPEVLIKLDEVILHDGPLTEVKNFKIEPFLTRGEHTITVELFNKTDANTGENFDQAVEITGVTFENIGTERFVWAGKYTPKYPEPWASEQTGPLPLVLTNSTVMGWNGRWELEFTTPIFTWIHKLEMLGWIYE